MTSKAMLLLWLSWGLTIVLVGLAFASLLLITDVIRFAVFFLILFAAPYLLAYLMIGPVVFIDRLIQRPLQEKIINKSKATLKGHKAIKIAIAGSYGKTSMREILKTVLASGKKVAAPPHSYNTPLGICQFINTLEGDEDVLIFELGEYYPGDIRKLCDLVQPDMGIITGINEAHLQKFKTLDKTVGTIYELADYLGEKPLYVNAESDLASKSKRPGNALYNRDGVAMWSVSKATSGLEGTNFVLSKENVELDLHSSLLGLHQIGPLAAAVDIASRLGLTRNQIEEGIGQTKPFDHRLEPKTGSDGVITLDDSYNGNPDGVRAVIQFLASIKGHRRFYVTPGLVEMGPATEAVHGQIGKSLAESGIENVILIKNSVTKYIESGLVEFKYKGKVIWFNEALEAFKALPNITVEGDVVLLQNDWSDQY
jgi:UDP-N-acetylmuramoyl-tripeptide--D-alanyl-D-alanine ligase